jgi:4-hydroxyphenylacetate 3-monooxygenase
MLKSGQQHLESLRDGRVVYVGKERIDDVTAHPWFANGAHSMAALYDMKAADPSLSFEENGERFSNYFLRARSREDLEKRYKVHQAIANASYGMFGRSPDHVSSFVTVMSMKAEVLGQYADNLMAYYEHIRRNDIYVTYAVLPPQGARSPEYYKSRNSSTPALRVVREDSDGVVISGMKMLATGAVFCNEIWVGNLIPLTADQSAESITCAVPCNAPGLSLWSRKPMEANAANEFEAPLTYRYDESDAMLICDEVKIPWGKVFVHNDATLAQQIYVRTAAHAYGNHQSNVRYLSKLRLLVGLASRIAQATGFDQVQAARSELGRLASLEATLAGLIDGQIQGAEEYPGPGWKCPNRRYIYAGLNFCTENYSPIVDKLRELCGGGVFQMPADISVLEDPKLAKEFFANWDTPQLDAVSRMKLFKLAWDLVGTEFAGRHQQYEKFYAGNSLVVRNNSYLHAHWDALHKVVDDLLASYGPPAGG